MTEVIWTDDDDCVYDDIDGMMCREWPPHSTGWVKLIEGEIIEEIQSPPMLERGKMAVSSNEGRDSRTAHGAGAGNASNISLPVPVLRGLAPDEAGAKNK